MNDITLDVLRQRLEFGEELLARKGTMFHPQDLPGRYGRVVQAIDRVLKATGCEAVVAGGWGVWHHGFIGRLTQDIDIVLAADHIDEFLQAAAVSGFMVRPADAGRWPRLHHKETNVEVDILPEGGRPGTANHAAPTTIRHPSAMGAAGTHLRYISLPALIELKLAAGRARDESDVVELMRIHPDKVDVIRQRLQGVHADYVGYFDRLVARAREQTDA